MALVLADRVLETTSVAGTGDAALGGAQTGFQPFSVIGNGSTTYYTIVGVDENHQPTGEWEVGIGTYVSTGNYISRDTVLSSSNGGAKVYFASGTKDIFLDLPSEEVLLSAGDVTGPASAVANNFAAFNMTTGKLIKDSGYNASSFATAAQGTLADTAIQPGDLGTAAYLDAGSALGVATLDAGGKVPTSQIPQMGDLNYQGTWNASTNSPTLTSSAGTKGFYYVVAVAGSTNLNGITDWKIGDWAVFNGSVWEKIDNTDAVTSVNGFTGTVVLTATDVGAAPATSGTAILYGNGSGGFSNVTVGSGLTFVAGTLASTGGGGTGDVVGPSSATDNAITRFDTTTGKLIQNSTVTLDDAGNVDQVNSITFDTTPTTTPSATGAIFWDSGNKSPSVNLDADVVLQLGQENVALVYNGTGSTITNGSVVAVSGAQGQRPSVVLADADSEALSAPTLGIATEDIANGAEGFVTTFGFVRGLDTSAFTAGDPIYLSQTAGQFTATRPSAPAHTVALGWVIKINASSGEVFVNINNGWELDELHNVKITSPTGGQIFTYDQTNGYWKNTSLSAGTGMTVTPTTGGALTVTNSAPDQTVAITGAGGAVVTGTYPNFTVTTPSGTVTSVSGTSPIASTGGATPAISISQATTSTNGYLSSTDWNTFNGKGNGTVTSVTGTAPVVSSGGATPAISMAAATTSVNGYLTSTDWNTFNGKYSTGGALGTPSSGTLTNCTGYTYANLSGTVPTWNQNTTGTAANVTGIVAAVNGGTGQSSYAVGDIVYASTTTALSKLADVATGNALISGGVGVAPSYGKIGLTTHVSGTLAVGNGGTGVATLTGLAYGNATSAFTAATAAQVVAVISTTAVANATAAVTFSSTTQNSQFNSIGVGTAASTTAGQIRATDNITAFYSSDRRLKEDIKPITEALDKVNAIGGVEFDWTDEYIRDNGGADGYFLRKHDFGVIAQDVQAVFPLAVRERENGKLAVDYEKLVALAFAAIKELKAEVDSLKGK